MKKHLVENHTDISADQEFIFVDCLSVEGPVNSKYLQKHMGTHPDLLRGVVRRLSPEKVRLFHEHNIRWMTEGSEKRPKDMCVVFVSKGDSWRSLAVKWLYHDWVSRHEEKYLLRGEEILIDDAKGTELPECSKL